MVILKVQRTTEPGLENAVVINSNVQELRPFSEIQVTKSNGTQHRFRLIMNSYVTNGYILINEKESKLCRLHLKHKYRVEGVELSMINKKAQIDYTKLKLAGCTPAIEEIVKKVFRPRKFSADLCREIGVQYVRGVILHGPPGTGKTSTILALCEYFGLEPKVINGPELIKSVFGKSEQAVRELFEEAILDQENKGDSSPLHVIVFDEMDALFRKRTSDSGACETRNGIVTQLLTMLDGEEKLNNIIVFGTTNRFDMLEPALLRRGRFDLQIKIDLPNARERLEIMNYHLRGVRKSGSLSSNVLASHLEELANITNNYSAADMAGIVQEAISEAFARAYDNIITDLGKLKREECNICVEWNDLVTAFHKSEKMRQIGQAQFQTKEIESIVDYN
ncbi:unnamed protein product [Adineta steineri]|uniref:Vesicle-fusing ATPase n=3 Tax=Adineta steineri TaxID=433720 RepID=A0A815CBT8_9BILA|nr:unnamed protein product [Adineta steineri]